MLNRIFRQQLHPTGLFRQRFLFQTGFQSSGPTTLELRDPYSRARQVRRSAESVQDKSRKTTYTFQSPKHGAYTVQAVLVKRYSKGRYARHKSKWFAYAIAGLPAGYLPAQVFELYRDRFGIESGYRQMNLVRAPTSTRNPAIRLLLVGLAFVLLNLYISLRQNLSSALKYPLKIHKRFWLSLRRVAFLLAHAIERLWGITEVLQQSGRSNHQPLFALS